MAKANPKAPPANTTTSQTEALADLARGYPRPPGDAQLSASERRYLDGILQARLPQAWAQVDLAHAVNLARCFADLDRYRRRLSREGMVTRNAKSGASKLNPVLALVDGLSNRSIALTRLLQLHAVPRVGPTRDQGARKGEAIGAAKALDEPGGGEGFNADDLLAKPGTKH